MNETCAITTGQCLELRIEAIAYGGEGVGRYGGLVVFVPLAAPGDLVRVRVIERKKNYARARIQEVIEASPQRVLPACGHFGVCGGCQLQHLSYKAQLEAKAQIVLDALRRIGGIEWPHDVPVKHADEYGYRARASVKVNPPAVGFNQSGSRAICDVENCPVLLPELNDALRMLHDKVGTEGNGLTCGEVAIAVGENGIAFAPPVAGLPGGLLKRTVGGAEYWFAASGFFQGNAKLLEGLVTLAVGERSGSLAVDLYAGVGLFTIQLSKRFERVIGVESDARAVSVASRNLSAAGASNVEFNCALAEEWLTEYAKGAYGGKENRPDLIVLNPPRTGAQSAVKGIATVRPNTVVYVSCDPPTLARDLATLTGGGYQIESLTALDMFPQTFHVETVASLKLTI